MSFQAVQTSIGAIAGVFEKVLEFLADISSEEQLVNYLVNQTQVILKVGLLRKIFTLF